VDTGLISALGLDANETATETASGAASIPDVLWFLVLLAIVVAVSRAAYYVLRRALDGPAGRRQSKTVASFVQYAILVFGVYAAFSNALHVNFTSFVLSLGIVGIAVAFASQQIVQNMLSGLMIAIIRPIQLEDWVDVGGLPTTSVARVKDITLMNTVLREPGGRIVVVPNSSIMNAKLVNYTKAGFFAAVTKIWIDPSSDMEAVRAIVYDVADIDPYILPKVDGEEKRAFEERLAKSRLYEYFDRNSDLVLNPKVEIVDLQGGRMLIQIKVWIRDASRQDGIMSGFLEELRRRFEQAGIKLRDS